MTSREDLTALLARVEAATGPDRELDEALARVGGYREYTEHNGKTGDRRGWHDGRHKARINFTASLDAALALVERVLPGAMWSSVPGYPDGKRRGQTLGVHIDRPVGAHWATHDVPAIALLAALLRALIAGAQQ